MEKFSSSMLSTDDRGKVDNEGDEHGKLLRSEACESTTITFIALYSLHAL